MSEPSVTDIQKVLREHAEMGHDVISEPQRSIIEGTPYGLRSRAQLNIWGPGHADTSLMSDILQSERPLLSRFGTSSTTKGMYLYPLFPHRNAVSTPGKVHDTFSDMPDSPFLYPEMEFDSKGLYTEISGKTVHDALKAHVNFRTDRAGSEYLGGDSYKFYSNMGEFSPAFDLRAALKNNSRYTGHDPFSGIITVHYHPPESVTSYSVYGYDPKTEQLIRHA